MIGKEMIANELAKNMDYEYLNFNEFYSKMGDVSEIKIVNIII
jgi:hypothetical protein